MTATQRVSLTKDVRGLDFLIKSLEDTFVRNVRTEPIATISVTLLLDLRNGSFSFKTVMQSGNGRPLIIPRATQVEEAGQVKIAASEGPLCAYKSVPGTRWVACTVSRLQQIQPQLSYETTTNALDRAMKQPLSKEIGDAERLLFAFIGPMLQADTGHDYDQVAVLVDTPSHVTLLEHIFGLLAAKMGREQSGKWSIATIIPVSASLQLTTYSAAFFAHLQSKTMLKALIINNHAPSVLECNFDGIDVKSIKRDLDVDVHVYDLIALVGFESRAHSGPKVWTFGNDAEFEAACWAGWVLLSLVPYEQRLAKLTAERDKLAGELNAINNHVARTQSVIERLSKVLGNILRK